MNKKYILVEVPGDWVPAMCPDCHIQYSQCSGICGELKCALTNAREAVEVSNDEVKQAGYMLSVTAGPEINGKPVKLWATLEEK